MKKTLLLSLAIFFTVVSFALSDVKPIQTSIDPSLHFIQNNGQWDSKVQFLARLGGLDYWVTNTGVTYEYYRVEREPIPEPKPLSPEEAKNPETSIPKIKNRWGHVIQNSFVGMNPSYQVIPEEKMEGVYNYFFGNEESKWVTNAPIFSSIKLKDIYKGIDVVYFFDNNEMRYDFQIAPFADPSQIQMKFDGQNEIKVSPAGDLLMGTSLGDVTHTKLFAYQDISGSQKQIDCKFVDKGNGIISFDITGYDPSKPIVIDPTVVFITYFGRNNTDYVFSTFIDPSGQAVQTGYTYSTNLPTTTGAFQGSIQSTPCGYVVKMNSAGNGLIFCTYLGGNNSTYPYGGCSSDQNGNTYLAGYTYATNFPTTSGAFQTTGTTFPEMFITKLNTTGSALGYSTYLGGNNTDVCYGMHADLDGYAYVTGYSYSTNYPTSSGAFQSSIPYTSYPNVFCTKLNQSGTALAMSSFYGSSSGYGYGNSVSSDASGNPYITGYTYATNFPTTSGAWKTSGTTTPEIFIAKFNASGTSLSYATYLQGNSTDIAYNIAVDQNNGEATVVGYTYSTNYAITPGALQSTLSSTPEGFITRMNSNGTGLIFSTFLGGNSTDYCYGVTCTLDGNVHVGGYTYSSNFPGITSDGYQKTISSTPDAFLSSFNSTGSLLYGTYLGGNSTDQAYYFKCLGSNSENQVVIGGITSSSNFPVTAGAYQTSVTTTYEGWIAKFQYDPPIAMEISNVYPLQMCKGDEFQVSLKITKGKFKPDNICKVQLSDEFGDFPSKPTVIGQLAMDQEGSITCTMPTAGIGPSSDYKVRIVSSNPAFVTEESIQSITLNPAPFGYDVVGDNGYCADAKLGAEVILQKSEKYSYYQLYRDGIKVGTPLAGTNMPLNFGRFKQPGIYNIEGISPYGCKNMMAGFLDIKMIPLPDVYNVTGGGLYYDQPGNGNYCEGDIGVAIGLSHGDFGVNYTLKLDGVDASVPTAGQGSKFSFGYFTEPGTYTIEALSKQGGCFAPMNGTITVTMLPAPTVYKILSSGKYCEGTQGNEIKLNGSESGFTYTVFMDGKSTNKTTSGTGNEISLGYFNKAGVYTVLAINSTTGCTKLMDGEISLAPVPSPTVFNITGSGKFCQGSDGAVIAIDNSQSEVLYELYNNNIATGYTMVGTGSEITFPPVSENGNYTVVGTTISGNCSISMSGNVVVSQVALPNVNITGNFNPEMNTTETYSIEAPVSGDSYLWKVNNGEIIGSNTSSTITVKWADSKLGSVEVYRTNEFGCANSTLKTAALGNQLVADFIVKPALGDVPFLVEFENASTGYISSYLWEFGDGITSPQENPTHTYKQVGKYTVSLTVGHETDTKKVSKTDIVTVLPANSVDDDGESLNSNGTAGISLIEPNPAKTEIKFDYFLTYAQNIDLAIYDVLGNKVLEIVSGLVAEGNNTMNIDISKLLNGNYYLQLSTADGNVTKHFNVVK